MALVARIALGAILLAAAAAKATRLQPTAGALRTYGIPPRLRMPLAWALVAIEALLGVSVAAGVRGSAYAAAVLLAAFAGVTAWSLARGRGGAPCACFGARSRIGPAGLVRDVLLAAAFVVAPSLPAGSPSVTGWLAIGLAAAFACVGALTVAVLALAREVGLLRLRLREDAALDIADEGPPLGTRITLGERAGAAAGGALTLAIFSSEGCRLCQTLRPVVAAFRRDPLLAVAEFDEVRDADVWRELRIPGSPYAVALDPDGEVRAKGTFNSYGQLEGIVATAERRLAGAAHA